MSTQQITTEILQALNYIKGCPQYFPQQNVKEAFHARLRTLNLPQGSEIAAYFDEFYKNKLESWEHFSGDLAFPTFTYSSETAAIEYRDAKYQGTMWKHKYGEANFKLLNYLIESLELHEFRAMKPHPTLTKEDEPYVLRKLHHALCILNTYKHSTLKGYAICYGVYEVLQLPYVVLMQGNREKIEQYWQQNMIGYFRSWKDFSGDDKYPVRGNINKHGVHTFRNTPREAYRNAIGDFWEGEYGSSRTDLLLHILTCISTRILELEGYDAS